MNRAHNRIPPERGQKLWLCLRLENKKCDLYYQNNIKKLCKSQKNKKCYLYHQNDINAVKPIPMFQKLHKGIR